MSVVSSPGTDRLIVPSFKLSTICRRTFKLLLQITVQITDEHILIRLCMMHKIKIYIVTSVSELLYKLSHSQWLLLSKKIVIVS